MKGWRGERENVGVWVVYIMMGVAARGGKAPPPTPGTALIPRREEACGPCEASGLYMRAGFGRVAARGHVRLGDVGIEYWVFGSSNLLEVCVHSWIDPPPPPRDTPGSHTRGRFSAKLMAPP